MRGGEEEGKVRVGRKKKKRRREKEGGRSGEKRDARVIEGRRTKYQG